MERKNAWTTYEGKDLIELTDLTEDYKEFLCNYHCLEILVMCFSRCRKFYTQLKLEMQYEIANQGGVE